MRVRGAKSGFRKTIPFRRELRRRQTFAEQRFWAQVSDRQFFNLKFRRQYGIGPYIADFYCPERKLVVEIDGDTHADEPVIRSDEERTKKLTALGYTVTRYTNHDVMHRIEDVLYDLSVKLRLL